MATLVFGFFMVILLMFLLTGEDKFLGGWVVSGIAMSLVTVLLAV